MKKDIEMLIKRVGINLKNINAWDKKGFALLYSKKYGATIGCFDVGQVILCVEKIEELTKK